MRVLNTENGLLWPKGEWLVKIGFLYWWITEYHDALCKTFRYQLSLSYVNTGIERGSDSCGTSYSHGIGSKLPFNGDHPGSISDPIGVNPFSQP